MEESHDSNNYENQDSLIKGEESKTSLIIFAKINKYFLIPFLCPVFCMLAHYFISLVDETKVIKKGEFFLTVLVELSYTFAGLLYFISYFQQKIEEAKKEIVNRERPSLAIKYIYNELANKNTLKEWIIIIFLGFIISLVEMFDVMIANNKVFEERLYFLIFIPLFSKIILKETIFMHQYISLIIALVGIIILIIPVCLVISREDIIANILTFITGISYSLFLNLIKYMTHVFYISPFKLCLFIGLISLGFTLCGFLIYSLIEYHNLSYFEGILDFSEVDNIFPVIIFLILILLFATTLHSLTLLVIFYFSPILLMVTDIISPMLLWLIITIQNGQDLPNVVLNPIGYIIVLFASLIYNEIIIFNFCNLSKNTKKFVEKRLDEESSDLRKTENDLRIGGSTTSDNDSIDDEKDDGE